MRVGRVLKQFRERNGWGIRKLAPLIGLSNATLSRVENGKPVDGATLWKIQTWLFEDGKFTAFQNEAGKKT